MELYFLVLLIAIMVFALAWLLRKPSDFSKLLLVMLGSAALVALVALQNKAAGIGLVEGTRVTIAFNTDAVENVA